MNRTRIVSATALAAVLAFSAAVAQQQQQGQGQRLNGTIERVDGNIVYACATGHLWDDNQERGVYRTTDGGKTWSQVLAGANGSTGCAMLSMSAQEPKTIYAAMWDFRRQAWIWRCLRPFHSLRLR